MRVCREEFLDLIKKNGNNLPVLELRTSEGGYDYTYNCWIAEEALLRTTEGIFVFGSVGDPDKAAEFTIEKVDHFEADKFPYAINAPESMRVVDMTLFTRDYDDWDEITMEYDNCLVWFLPEDFGKGIDLSLHEGSGKETHLKYEGDSMGYKWDFIDERTGGEPQGFQS